jgi:hypothetical protein
LDIPDKVLIPEKIEGLLPKEMLAFLSRDAGSVFAAKIADNPPRYPAPPKNYICDQVLVATKTERTMGLSYERSKSR